MLLDAAREFVFSGDWADEFAQIFTRQEPEQRLHELRDVVRKGNPAELDEVDLAASKVVAGLCHADIQLQGSLVALRSLLLHLVVSAVDV